MKLCIISMKLYVNWYEIKVGIKIFIRKNFKKFLKTFFKSNSL